MIGVETQSQLVEKVNRQKATDHFRMITYNIFKGLKARDLEHLIFSPEQVTCKRVHIDSPIPDYGFIGLHCCGDLSASMCRLFIEADAHCKLLSFVGCCYNLLTTVEETNEAIAGFPLNPDVVSVSLSHRARNCIVQVISWIRFDVEHAVRFGGRNGGCDRAAVLPIVASDGHLQAFSRRVGLRFDDEVDRTPFFFLLANCVLNTATRPSTST